VITIYSVSGRAVRQLVNADRKVGRYSVHWDGRDAQGGRVAGGMYLVRIKAGNFTATRKLMFMK
jgi:flagellar hook assembly protein FlgD